MTRAGHTSRPSPRTSIQILRDEPLLKIFQYCRPVSQDDDEADDNLDQVLEERKWDNERWWYRLTHICREWRYLVLTSASYLGLRLVCTYGKPVATMLAHSPPLPLIIDYGDEHREVTTRDEEGILLALRRRRRVCRIRLWTPTSSLRRLVESIDGEFPMLEYLYIKPLTSDDGHLSLPEALKAPHLRHFKLRNVTYFRAMSRPPPPSFPFQSTEKVIECARCSGPQLWRFASLQSCLSAR